MAVPTKAALVVTEVMSSSAHGGGSNNADWFELTNNGTTDFSLTGLAWNDSSTDDGHTPFTGASMIRPGESIIITGEPTDNGTQWATDWGITGLAALHQGSAFHNFSSGGDTVQIFDSVNNVILQLAFGEADEGFTLEWDQQGNPLGVSAAGENGAIQSTSDGNGGAGQDVGSPGISVIPEPGAVLLCAVAGLGMIGRRARR